MTKKNEISLSANQIAEAWESDLFKDVDFSGLNGAIENIGDTSKDLTDKEKELAIDIVGEWNQNVLSRLRQKDGEMEEFIRFFDLNSYVSRDRYETVGAELAERTGTTDLFDKFLDLLDDIEELEENAPEPPIVGLDTKIEEKLSEQKDYELELQKHRIEEEKLRRKAHRTERAWKRELKKDPGVKELLAKAKKYQRNVSKLYNDCHSKTQAAKLNISIGSKEARLALKELLDFTTAI